jgi:cysteinyl-tRNA synthetase
MVTIEEFLVEHESDVLRLMVLNASYRAPLTFTDKVIDQATSGLNRLRGALRPANQNGNREDENTEELISLAEQSRKDFEISMDNDFKTSGALASLFDLVRNINQARDSGATDSELSPAQQTLKKLAGILGLRLAKKRLQSQDVVPFVELLITIRKDLREANEWALADRSAVRYPGLRLPRESRRQI